ncbi:MAG TPA: RHS repeat-associated core domain-containing protein [Gemmataceae bacterium]|nr:RHS repeat-associated core domain-containing protein [Gemmataceae bacterium]
MTRFALDGWKNAGPGLRGNEAWDVWADLDGDGSLTNRYLHGDAVDQVFADIAANGDVSWYLTDQLGSVRDMVDRYGQVRDALTYDGFGNVVVETDPAQGSRFGWTSREYDAETGLQYNRARYYDPRTGRFLSEDPLGLGAGDPNFYRYVGNAPTTATDPSGLFDESLFWENVEKRVPGLRAWWEGPMQGRVVQRYAGWWRPLRPKVSPTYEEGKAVIYLHEGFNEVEAATAFIHEATQGYFADYWKSRHLADPVNYPNAGQEWRDWYVREMAKTTLAGAATVGAFYSLGLKGVDWAVTINDAAEGNLGFVEVVNLLRILPFATNGKIKIATRSGKTIAEIPTVEARQIVASGGRGEAAKKLRKTLEDFRAEATRRMQAAKQARPGALQKEIPGVATRAPARGRQAVDALMAGRRGGTVLSEARFTELQRMLRDEHNVILWIDREGRVLQEGQGALYRAYPNGPSFMYVRPDVTEYELAHESFHMFHHQALGQRYFMTGMDRTAANLIREQYVFDQMIESSVWNSLTRAEQQHAIGYIRSLGGNTRGMIPRGGP